jgi:chemotaxis protein MotB
MGRRKHVEEHSNHERWLVSYADFITLLFAFFVVMYSISQVNQSKFRVLSNTLEDAFHQPELAVEVIQIGEKARSNPTNLVALNVDAAKLKEGNGGPQSSAAMPDEFKEVANKIAEAFGGLMAQGLVTMRGNEEWLEIEMKSSLLFDSGDAALSNNALEVLGQIATILREQKNAVRVEGFTDDKPIHTARYPSNWELSSARAAAVVQLFVEEGMDASRLVAAGYGQAQPVVPNDTPENRTKNRRVVLMISKTGELRPQLKPIGPAAVSDPAAAPSPISGGDQAQLPAPQLPVAAPLTAKSSAANVATPQPVSTPIAPAATRANAYKTP